MVVSSLTILVVLNLVLDCHWGLVFAGTVMLMGLLIPPKADEGRILEVVVVVVVAEPEVKPEVNPLLL